MAYFVCPAFTEAYLELVRPWEVGSRQEQALFVGHTTGKRLSYRTVGQIPHRVARRTGLDKPVGPHTLRRSMATHMLRNKADLRHIQMLLGHASIGTTALYAHLEVEDLKEVVKRAHPHGRRAG